MSARFWWVNHSHTSRYEIDGAYLWFAQKTPKSKARSESEKNVLRLLPGDVVFSFSEGAIGAVGVVLAAARESAKPAEFGAVAEHAEADNGWLAPVRFMPLESPLLTEDHSAALAPVLPRKHAPIRPNGAGNRHVLLAEVAMPMATTVQQLLNGEVERIVETITEAVGRSLGEDAAEAAIHQRTDIGPTHKALLLKARHGQGVFRENLEMTEHSCRVTGVLDRRHLRATHIKPWHECADGEMLDGGNGLLMSPHVAHLFDRGYVSFLDDGELLVSQELNPAVLESWGIKLPRNVGGFNPEQCAYLEFHRQRVFQQHGGGRRQKGGDHIGDVPVELSAEPAIVTPA